MIKHRLIEPTRGAAVGRAMDARLAQCLDKLATHSNLLWSLLSLASWLADLGGKEDLWLRDEIKAQARRCKHAALTRWAQPACGPKSLRK